MTKKLKFALFGNIYQERKSAAVQKFFAIATERKADIAIPESFYEFLRDNLKIRVPECEIIKDNHWQIITYTRFLICVADDKFLTGCQYRNIIVVGVVCTFNNICLRLFIINNIF